MAALIPGVEPDTLVLILVLVMVIEGVWLTGLTYLLWKRAKKREMKASEEEETPDEPTTST